MKKLLFFLLAFALVSMAGFAQPCQTPITVDCQNYSGNHFFGDSSMWVMLESSAGVNSCPAGIGGNLLCMPVGPGVSVSIQASGSFSFELKTVLSELVFANADTTYIVHPSGGWDIFLSATNLVITSGFSGAVDFRKFWVQDSSNTGPIITHDTVYVCDFNQTGVDTLLFQNQANCDSVVIRIRSLAEDDFTVLPIEYVCDFNQTGVDTLLFQNQANCDSVVIRIRSLAEPIIFDSDQQDVSCFGESNGWIKIFTDPENTISWSNDGDGTALSAGIYSVTVTDTNGCEAGSSFLILEPDPISVVLDTVGITVNGAKDGAIIANISGSEPMDFFWSNGDTGHMIQNLGPGTYSVTVTDANGCEAEALIELHDPPVMVDPCEVKIKQIGQTSAQITVVTDKGDIEEVQIFLYNSNGRMVRNSMHSSVGSNNFSTDFSLVGLQTGLYVLDVRVKIGGDWYTLASLRDFDKVTKKIIIN
jgi:hypothetical protein